MKDKMKTLILCLRDIWKDIKQMKWALVLLVIYWAFTRLIFGEFCLMRILTGLPCPGCGATRAAFLVFCLKWKEASQMNPTIFLWIPFLLYLLWQRYLAGERRKRVCKKISDALLIMVCAAALIWYGIGMFRHFPGREPFTYFEGNLLRYIFLNSGMRL